eukprot:1146220-Pelagomonas_calceolata.AAC.3
MMMAWCAQMCMGACRTPVLKPMSDNGAFLQEPKEGYEVVIVSNQEHGPYMLKCKGCGESQQPLANMQATQLFMQAPSQGGEEGPSRPVKPGAVISQLKSCLNRAALVQLHTTVLKEGLDQSNPGRWLAWSGLRNTTGKEHIQ